MEKFIDIDICQNHHNIDNITNMLNHCKKIINDFSNMNVNNKLTRLLDHMYIINYYYAMSGLMQLCNSKTSIDVDTMLKSYIKIFYSNNVIYNFLDNIKNNTKLDYSTKTFVNKLFNNFNKQIMLPNAYKINKKINSIVDTIRQNMDKDIIVKLSNKTIIDDINSTMTPSSSGSSKETDLKSSKSDYKKNINSIVLNRLSYTYFQRNIKSSSTRQLLEKIYYEKSYKNLNMFAELIVLRSDYACELGYNNYFQYRKNGNGGDSDDIVNLISDLINKIDDCTKKEITKLHRELTKDGFKKNVDSYDISYYCDKLENKNKFSPNNVINTIFNIIKNLFKISFKKSHKIEKLWNSNVITFNACDDKNQIIGYLYVDINNNNKNITVPTYVSLNHKYKNILPKIVLLGNYASLQEKIMSYHDVVIMFKEFGHIIQNITCNTSTGCFYNDVEFENMMPKIMEHLAWNKKIIKMIYNNDHNSGICQEINSNGTNDTIVDHIVLTRQLNMALTLKNNCIIAIFDHIIHNSESVISLLKENNANAGETLLNIYQKIYKDFIPDFELVNQSIYGIDPCVIIQEINGNEGLLFGNILCEILSYSIYKLVEKGCGSIFIKNVLMNDSLSMRTATDKFINSNMANNNYYSLYLRDVIGYIEKSHDNIDKSDDNIDKQNVLYYDDYNDNEPDKEQIF